MPGNSAQQKIDSSIREQRTRQFDAQARLDRLTMLVTHLSQVFSPSGVISERFTDTLFEAEISVKRAQARWLMDNEPKKEAS